MPESLHMEKTRACTHCSRAKVKCIWPAAHDNDATICQRLVLLSLYSDPGRLTTLKMLKKQS